METSWLLAVLLVPAAGTILITLAGQKHANLREAITVITSLLLFACVMQLYGDIHQPAHQILKIAEPLNGLVIALVVEPLGMLFGIVCSFLWIITSIYSIGYMRAHHEKNLTRFYACFALAIAATMGVAFSANMFSMFIFYELLTLVTYPLVTHSGTTEAKKAGRLYLGYLLGTSIGLQLLAIVGVWSIAGTLDFRSGGVFGHDVSSAMILALYLLFIFGIGKAAVMPVHRWLPAAMVAPTPVSALLHAVAVVKAGVFCILKITVYLFGIDVLMNAGVNHWVVYIAGATIIIASLIALTKNNLKARLAYSTISQLSYVVMGTVILAPVSILAAALHIAVHAFGKITLFFSAGSIYISTHKTDVSELNGVGHYMPWTMSAFAIGSISMIGVPPAAGFLSKWYLLQGALSMQQWFAVIVVVLSTLLNGAYFLPIVYRAFFLKPDNPEDHSYGESPLLMVSALMVCAIGTVLIFLFPQRIIDLIKLIAI